MSSKLHIRRPASSGDQVPGLESVEDSSAQQTSVMRTFQTTVGKEFYFKVHQGKHKFGGQVNTGVQRLGPPCQITKSQQSGMMLDIWDGHYTHKPQGVRLAPGLGMESREYVLGWKSVRQSQEPPQILPTNETFPAKT